MRVAGRIGRALSILAMLALGVACAPAAPQLGASPAASQRDALPALRPLDERHAAEFRRAFEDTKDRPRYVVALSPT